MPATAKQPELVSAEAPAMQLAIRNEQTNVVRMFERLAKDPTVDVEKLERLIAMQERIIGHNARAAFESAFAEMQGDLPAIDEKGQILVNGAIRSRYARYEDIQQAIRPILKRHGFALRHREEDLPDGKLRIIGILSHRQGHREEDKFDCPPDTSGGKSNIQAIGSTRSYGMRYTTISLLNIETRGLDNDGQSVAEKQSDQPVPDGYDDWLTDMHAAADEGWPKLSAAFSKSILEYRKYVTGPDKAKWAELRARAEKRA